MTIPAPLIAHYRQATTTVADFLRVQRADGAVYGFTSTDRAVTVDGLLYQPGFDTSAIASAEGLQVDNLNLTILPDEEGGAITATDLLAGRWSSARFELFTANYLDPSLGIERKLKGSTGEVKYENGVFVVEFRDITQSMQMQQGIALSPTCRARLGDARCRLDLVPFTVTSSITSAASPQQVADDNRTEADDWFGDGELTATSGDNAGLTRRVKSYTGAGVFTFDLPFPFEFAEGDAYSAIPGCRKRHERSAANPTAVSDCIDKFDNVLNFFGEPDVPGLDAATRREE